MTMLEEIKKMQGINHNDFDESIKNLIEASRRDLEAIGIVDSLLDEDPLVIQARITYALSFLDVNNSEMYAKSYLSQKDALRHYNKYISNSEPKEVENGI